MIVAQIFGILGMAANILSYQCRHRKEVLRCQFFGSFLFAINMYLLDAMMGCLLNAVGIFRTVTYSYVKKPSHIRLANGLFLALYVLAYVSDFTWIGLEPTTQNLILEALPLVAMFAITFACSRSAKVIRRTVFISSPLWLVYDAIGLSLGGVICEVISIVSAVIGTVRYDIRKESETTAENHDEIAA